MINGNIDGIKKCFIEALDEIYKIRTNKDELASRDIINIITRVSSDIQKEVSVAIDRKGKVTSVSIGDSTSVELPILDVREQRLSGIRIIHTHPNGYSNLSAMDLSALLKLKLDAIVAVGIYEGKIIDISIGTLMVSNNVLITEERFFLIWFQ